MEGKLDASRRSGELKLTSLCMAPSSRYGKDEKSIRQVANRVTHDGQCSTYRSLEPPYYSLLGSVAGVRHNPTVNHAVSDRHRHRQRRQTLRYFADKQETHGRPSMCRLTGIQEGCPLVAMLYYDRRRASDERRMTETDTAHMNVCGRELNE